VYEKLLSNLLDASIESRTLQDVLTNAPPDFRLSEHDRRFPGQAAGTSRTLIDDARFEGAHA
jgi:hypothetical protein